MPCAFLSLLHLLLSITDALSPSSVTRHSDQTSRNALLTSTTGLLDDLSALLGRDLARADSRIVSTTLFKEPPRNTDCDDGNAVLDT